MDAKKIILALMVAGSLLSTGCNKKSGCVTSEGPKVRVDVNNEKAGSFSSKKDNKSRQSSVTPAEIRYKKKK